MRVERSKSKNNVTSFATIVKKEIDELITIGLLDNATIPLNDFDSRLPNNTDQSSSPFVFPQNMTLEKYARVIQNCKGKKKGYLIRGLYAPLLFPWTKKFATDDRLMVIKFNEVFNESIVDEVLKFAGVVDTSVDEHYDDVVRDRRGKILAKAKRNNTHAMKGKEMPLDPVIRLYLKLFYQPFNRYLAQLLGDEWEGWCDSTRNDQ